MLVFFAPKGNRIEFRGFGASAEFCPVLIEIQEDKPDVTCSPKSLPT